MEEQLLNSYLQKLTCGLDRFTHTIHVSDIEINYRLDGSLLKMRLLWIQKSALIFEEIISLYELDLYKDWVPFCRFCRCIQEICKHSPSLLFLHYCLSFSAPIEFIIHIQLGVSFGLARELLLHVQTIDCLSQCDAIFLIGRSVQRKELPTSSLRAELHSLIVMFQMKSLTELQV
jgi:hypothetical protein